MVSDFRSLRGDIVFRPLLARQSPAAKIPFQTRIWRLIARVREASKSRCFCALARMQARPRHSAGMLARLLWRLRHDRSGVNRLKFAWKILRLRQVSLSEERILENFRTFSVGRPVGYP